MSIISIFNRILSQTKNHKSRAKEHSKLFEIILTIILVDLASDDELTYDEHDYIVLKLCKIFELTRNDIYGLIKKTEQILSDEKEISNYSISLHEMFSLSEREKIMELFKNLIKIHRKENKYETLFCRRYETLLNVDV